LLPVVAILYWVLRHPRLVPEWFAFAAGLCVDVLTNGPLGYWSLVYLAGYFCAVAAGPYAQSGQLARLVISSSAMLVTAATAWAVSSLYFLDVNDWRPLARGLGFSLVAGAFIVPFLHAFDVSEKSNDNPELKRGQ